MPSALVMASFFSTPPPLRCVELVELYKKDMGHIELRSRPPTLPAVRKSLFSYLFALSQLFGTERRGSGAAGMLGDGCGTVGSVGAGGVARAAVATVVATAAVARSMAAAAVAPRHSHGLPNKARLLVV